MPKILVRMATIFAPTWRKRCSTSCDTPSGSGTTVFKGTISAIPSRRIKTTNCNSDQKPGGTSPNFPRPTYLCPGTPVSDPFFFQVVDVEPVMHHPVTRNELLNIILHV